MRANEGQRQPTQASCQRGLQQQQGLETHRVSSPWYVFLLLLLFYILLTKHPMTADSDIASDGQWRPAQANTLTEANRGQHRDDGSPSDATRRLGPGMFVFIYLYFLLMTYANAGQRWPTTANTCQHRPAMAHDSQRRPVKANAGQLWPTTANTGQQWPTTANTCQRRPAMGHNSQRRPAKTNAGQRWPFVTQRYVIWIFFFFSTNKLSP